MHDGPRRRGTAVSMLLRFGDDHMFYFLIKSRLRLIQTTSDPLLATPFFRTSCFRPPVFARSSLSVLPRICRRCVPYACGHHAYPRRRPRRGPRRRPRRRPGRAGVAVPPDGS